MLLFPKRKPHSFLSKVAILNTKVYNSPLSIISQTAPLLQCAKHNIWGMKVGQYDNIVIWLWAQRVLYWHLQKTFTTEMTKWNHLHATVRLLYQEYVLYYFSLFISENWHSGIDRYQFELLMCSLGLKSMLVTCRLA